MRECIICGRQMSDDATTCGTCGFSSRRRFLSRTHYQSWMEQTVIPYRKKWERRTEEPFSKAEPALTEKSTEPDSQVNIEKQTVKRKPKKVFLGIIAVIVMLAVFALGVAVGSGTLEIAAIVSSSEDEVHLETLTPEEQLFTLITSVPDPSDSETTLTWIENTGVSFDDDFRSRSISVDSFSATYDYDNESWTITCQKTKQEYQDLQNQLSDAGYYYNDINTTQTKQESTFQLKDRARIHMLYYPTTKQLVISLKQFVWNSAINN